MDRIVRWLLVGFLTGGLLGCSREEVKEWFYPRKVDVSQVRTIAVVRVVRGDSIWKLVNMFQIDGATMAHTYACNGRTKGEALIHPGDEFYVCGPQQANAPPPLNVNR